MSSFKVCLLSADDPIYDGECVSLVIPVSDGEYGVMAHHCATVAAIVPGMVKYRTPDGVDHIVAVSDGMIRIRDNEAVILVDSAERLEEIDLKRAERELEDARSELRNKTNAMTYNMLTAKILRNINRINIYKKSGRL